MRPEQMEFDFSDDTEINSVITKKIRLITTFSGIGSQEMAFERLSKTFPINWEIYKAVEFDKYAIASYNAIHNTNFPTMDITKCHAEDFEIKDKDKYFYIFFYSFPCLTDDSLILTDKGYKELKNINVGDKVLTKLNRYRTVVKKFDNGIHDTCYVNSFGFKNLHCTLNHKFYVREMYRTYPTYENGKRGNIRHFKDPEFKEVKDLTRKDYFGIPVIEEEKFFYTNDLDFWYMIGFYIGDGWLGKNNHDVKLACNDSKLEKLRKHLDVNKWNYSVNEMNNSCHKFRFSNKEIYDFISKNIGEGCKNKHIPMDIITLPKAQLEAFLDGYIDSDGNINKTGKNDYIRITSVNENLIYCTSMIINKLYHRPASVNVDKVRKNNFINGRKITNNYKVYELKFKYSTDKQDKAFYKNGYIWFPFYNIQLADKDNVYNIEVEEDHSYIVNGCISKNCTDLSVAGKQAGMSKQDWESGKSTRSGLLWEVERILKEMGTNLPDCLIMENVTQVHGKKNIGDFNNWCNFLTEKGYTNFYQDMNSKFYGVAQNRDRCLMISLLGDFKFEFPKPMELKKVMADYLESKVDEKFYINNEKADNLIQQLIKEKKIPEVL